MTNVLIPTDFSDRAQNAINYAVEYFADIPAHFYLLHVPLSKSDACDAHESGTLQIPVSRQLEDVAIKCRTQTRNKQHHFTGILEDTSLVEAIRKNVADKSVNFIVMGTKSSRDVESNALGSKSVEIITKVKCTVLVVPDHVTFKAVRNIGFPTDYTLTYKHKILKTISEMLRIRHAELNVFEITSKQPLNFQQSENKIFLQDFLKEMKSSFHVVENHLIGKSVQNFIKSLHIEMIVMSAKNLNVIQQLLFKPHAFSDTETEQIPFLVIHEK